MAVVSLVIYANQAWSENGVAKVAAGYYHTMALKQDGTLWAWGRNSSGQLGNGSMTDQSSPMKINSDTNWTTVAAGGYHTIALKKDGTLWAWGDNTFGQVGNGSTANQKSPVKINSDTN